MKNHKISKKGVEKKSRVFIYTDKVFALHRGPSSHPERPDRILSIIDLLSNYRSTCGVFSLPSRIPYNVANLVHSSTYLDSVFKLPLIDQFLDPLNPSVFYESNDMYWNKHTSSCAVLAAGAVNDAVNKVINGHSAAAFALVRPPGHHAGTKRAEGFSWLNNVAIAAKNALNAHRDSVKKVLIFDWDVHHGNGTQEIFYETKEVLYISLHRFGLGFYPGTGRVTEVGGGEGKGGNVNIPWRQRRLGDFEYMAAFEAVVKPIVKSFDPDLILVSAGFDAAEGDRLGQMEVTPACFGWMAAELFCLGKKKNIVFALEGGYCLQALSNGVLSCVDAICRASNKIDNLKIEPIEATGEDKTDISTLLSLCENCKTGALETLKTVCAVQQEFWADLKNSLPVIDKILVERRVIELDEQKKIPRNGKNNGCVGKDEDISYFEGLGGLSSFMSDQYE